MLGCTLVFSLAACGDSSDSDSDSASDDTTVETSDESADEESDAEETATSSDGAYNIGFIVKLTDEHFARVMAGAQAYADENDNVSIEILSPTSATDYDGQTNMIETTLGNDDIDAVVISPLQSTTAVTLVSGTEKVIVACDTDFDAEEKSTFVGTGNYDAAYSGGYAAAEEAIARGAETPTAVILTGVQGDETHDARMEGYTAGFEDAGGEVLEVQYCDALADRAATAMEAIIQKYPEGVGAVLSTNDDMVVSAVKVISDSGSSAFENTVTCGFDGNQSAIEAVQEGTLTMDIAQLGYQMGYKAVEAAVAVLNGEEVETYIDSGSEIVASDDVEDYIAQMQAIGVWDE